mgnify:CR=1 FL=1
MSILVDENTKVVVQGITGNEGMFHTRQMVEYGTNVVAGVTPGKGRQKVEGIPVFNTVSEAVKNTGANAAAIFVPPAFATEAKKEEKKEEKKEKKEEKTVSEEEAAAAAAEPEHSSA